MIILQMPVPFLDDVVLASNNSRKLAELQRVFDAASLPVSVRALDDYEPYPEPAETEQTFEGNALIKAREAAKRLGVCAVADDSGLEVDVLNRMPGVRSARWAGAPYDDARNLDLVLAQLADVPADQRGARFVCALALVTPDGTERVWRETMEGAIAFSRAGTNGFGYDPIFVPYGHDVTSAELSPEAKDAISHRGKAIRAMVRDLGDVLGVRP